MDTEQAWVEEMRDLPIEITVGLRRRRGAVGPVEDHLEGIGEFLRDTGFSLPWGVPEAKNWHRLDRDTARRHLVWLLSYDQAYSGPRDVEASKAEELAGKFMGTFGEECLFLYTATCPSFERGGKGWTPLASGTMDDGVLALDERQIGIVWFEDEDLAPDAIVPGGSYPGGEEMTKAEEKLRQVHEAAVRIVELLRGMGDLGRMLRRGMKSGSPDLVDIDLKRRDLEVALSAARDALVPDPFAHLYDAPFHVESFLVTSGHDATLEIAEWLLAQTWSCEAFDEFFEKYYRGEDEGIDWKASEACSDRPTEWIQDMCCYGARQHQKLLNTEFARAVKEARVHRWVPDITADEKFVLLALQGGPGDGAFLAEQAQGDMHDSKFRAMLSQMQRLGLIEHDRKRGYWRGPLAEVALERAELHGI